MLFVGYSQETDPLELCPLNATTSSQIRDGCPETDPVNLCLVACRLHSPETMDLILDGTGTGSGWRPRFVVLRRQCCSLVGCGCPETANSGKSTIPMKLCFDTIAKIAD